MSQVRTESEIQSIAIKHQGYNKCGTSYFRTMKLHNNYGMRSVEILKQPRRGTREAYHPDALAHWILPYISHVTGLFFVLTLNKNSIIFFPIFYIS